jgi:hypothetical protein
LVAASPVQPVPGMARRAGLEEQGGEQALGRGHRGSRQELGSGCPWVRARLPGDGQSYTGSRCASPFPLPGVAGGPMPSSAAVRTSLRLAARYHLELPLRVAQRQLDSDLAEDGPAMSDVRGGADGHLRRQSACPVESPTASPGASIRENCDSEEEEGIFGGMTVPARMTVG